MMDVLNTPEAVAVLCLLMVGADSEIKQEELASMLTNPFFQEHVAEKIGPHPEFLQKYNQAKKQHGKDALEKRAIKALKSGFPALQLKTLALMTLIAGADGDYDKTEKELAVRVSTALNIPIGDVDSELEKMKEGIRKAAENGATTAKDTPKEETT